MRLRARVDRNQTEIVAALREAGFSVLSLAQLGKGVPDLLLSKGEVTFLAEVKTSEKEKLTPDQIRFHGNWKGRIEMFYSPEQAVEVANGVQQTNSSGIQAVRKA